MPTGLKTSGHFYGASKGCRMIFAQCTIIREATPEETVKMTIHFAGHLLTKEENDGKVPYFKAASSIKGLKNRA